MGEERTDLSLSLIPFFSCEIAYAKQPEQNGRRGTGGWTLQSVMGLETINGRAGDYNSEGAHRQMSRQGSLAPQSHLERRELCRSQDLNTRLASF